MHHHVSPVTRVDVLALFDGARKRKHGGANNPSGSNQHRKVDEVEVVNVDNIHVDQPDRPTGTSAAAGLRKLQKAAKDGSKSEPSMVGRAWWREVGEVASPGDGGAKIETFHLHDEVDHVAVLVCREAVIEMLAVIDDETEFILLRREGRRSAPFVAMLFESDIKERKFGDRNAGA
jgi:hypothetical protein